MEVVELALLRAIGLKRRASRPHRVLHPVGRLVSYPAGVAAQHRVFVPEHQQFSILRQVPAQHQDSEAEYPAN